MFRHTIYSRKVTINAPAERVWAVLTNLERYPDWNPFTFQVLGTLETGRPVELHVRMGKRGDTVSTETVQAIEPGRMLSWGMTMGMAVFLKARRDQQLQRIDDHTCSYQTWDAFSGLLTPIVVALYGRDIQQGFNAVADALKRYCEK